MFDIENLDWNTVNEDAILNGGDIKLIYAYTKCVSGINLEKFEDAIIESGDAFYMYHFTHDVKGVNVSKMEDAIIKSGNACYIYLFARNIDGADISKLEQAIIQSENVEYMYYFLCHVEDADVSNLKFEIAKVIKKEKNIRASYLSLNEIVNSEIFSRMCEADIECNREKKKGKQKIKYHSWF